jgi:hypothetical protein
MTTVSRSFFAAVLAAGLALLAPLHGQAQTANAEACPPASLPLDPARFQSGLRQAQDHGFLWRMTKDGRTSYLYGTLHAAEPAWMFPGPRTAAAFEASDVLALELDVLDADIRTRLIKAASARPMTGCPPPWWRDWRSAWPPIASMPLPCGLSCRSSRSHRWR